MERKRKALWFNPARISTSQAATLLNISSSTVYRAIKAGELKAWKEGTRNYTNADNLREFADAPGKAMAELARELDRQPQLVRLGPPTLADPIPPLEEEDGPIPFAEPTDNPAPYTPPLIGTPITEGEPATFNVHLDTILTRVKREVADKYRKGQKEHGGKLWRKAVLPHLMEEIKDLIVYGYTLERQLYNAASYMAYGYRELEKLDELVAKHGSFVHAHVPKLREAMGWVLGAQNILLFGNAEGEPEPELDNPPCNCDDDPCGCVEPDGV